jgi:DNA helicase-2/ATP-dependent DNA helicase PcrA
VFAVADDDQLVYEWRDARLETLREFEDLFRPDILVLRRNYRCPRRIVAVASAVIERNPDRRPKALVPVREDSDGLVTLSEWSTREEQATFVAERIATGIRERGFSLTDHAVLVRMRQSLFPIQEALTDLGLQWLELGGREVQSDPLVRLLMAALAHAADPGVATRGAIERTCKRVNATVESEIVSPDRVHDGVVRLSGTFRRGFLAEVAEDLAIESTLDAYGYTIEQRHVQRFLAMIELANQEAEWADYRAMERTIRVEFSALLQRVDSRHDAVRLTTIHGAKGAQFPVVFIPDLCDAAFPNMRARSRSRLANMAEERRLLFVAITRGQDEVHLSWAGESPWGQPGVNASPFVDDIMEGACDFVTMLEYPGEVGSAAGSVTAIPAARHSPRPLVR